MSLILLLCSLLTAAAEEADFATQMTAAKTAMTAKDWSVAIKALEAAEDAAPTSPALISNADLARIYFLHGVILYRQASSIDAAMPWWRKSLAIAPDFSPDKEFLPEQDAQDVFYALSEEQKSKDQVVLMLPEDPGDVMIFFDGKRYESSDSVYIGNHFVQLRCSEGNLVGSWYTLGSPPPDWLVLCTGGSYPSPDSSKKTKEKKDKPSNNSAPKSNKGGGNVAGGILLGTGAALLVGGTGANFLWVNPAWDAIDDANAQPGSVTVSEADAMQSRFNTSRYATLALLSLGTATAASGVVLTVVDWQISPMPTGLLLSHRW